MSVKHWTPRHWIAIGMMLSSVGAMGASAHTWRELATPAFVFGSLGAIGAVLVAIFSPKPSSTRDQVSRPDRFT
jgi:hypothetical protein